MFWLYQHLKQSSAHKSQWLPSIDAVFMNIFHVEHWPIKMKALLPSLHHYLVDINVWTMDAKKSEGKWLTQKHKTYNMNTARILILWCTACKVRYTSHWHNLKNYKQELSFLSFSLFFSPGFVYPFLTSFYSGFFLIFENHKWRNKKKDQ